MLLFSAENYVSTKTWIILIYNETNRNTKNKIKLAWLEFLPIIVNLNILDGRGLPA